MPRTADVRRFWEVPLRPLSTLALRVGPLDGGEDLRQRGTLGQEGAGPHPQELAPLAGSVIHSEDHDPGRGRDVAQERIEGFLTVHDRHRQVQDDYVRPYLPSDLDGLGAISGLPDDLDTTVGQEHLREPAAELGVVVCKHHPDGVVTFSSLRVAGPLHAAVYPIPRRACHGPKCANTPRKGHAGAKAVGPGTR